MKFCPCPFCSTRLKGQANYLQPTAFHGEETPVFATDVTSIEISLEAGMMVSGSEFTFDVFFKVV